MNEDFTVVTSLMERMNAGADDDTESFGYVGDSNDTSGIEALSLRMVMLASENEELKKRLNVVEARTSAMYTEFSKGKDRPQVKPNYLDTARNTDDWENASLCGTAATDAGEGVATVQEPSSTPRRSTRVREREMTATPVPDASQCINPFMRFSSTRDGSIFKSNSVVSPQGYVTNSSVWGTALASMLIGATRYYMTKRPSSMVMLDETKVASVYTKICPVLYEVVMSKPLPKVTDSTTKYLSKTIARMEKGEVPMSYAETWVEIQKNQEGKDIMSVLSTMIMASKMVPEAMVHPISQLIPSLKVPVVAENGENVIFAMDSGASVSPTPDKWEVWCSILKMNAITKHVKYRLSGMSVPTAIGTMMSEMKKSELTDKKNWIKLADMGPNVIMND